MGLRDRLKETVKGLLKAAPETSRPQAPEPPRSPVAAPVVVPAVAPVPSPVIAPVAPAAERAIAKSVQVPEGKAGTFALGKTDEVVAIFRHQGKLYAMNNACAHEDGPIGEGTVRGTHVSCPYHDWEYDFTTGACLTDPERRQTCWRVREEGGTIFLGPVAREGTATRGGEHNDGMEVIVK